MIHSLRIAAARLPFSRSPRSRKRRQAAVATAPQDLEPRRLLTNMLGKPPELRFDVVNETVIRAHYINDDGGFAHNYVDVWEEDGQPENYRITSFGANGLFVIVLFNSPAPGETKLFRFTPVEMLPYGKIPQTQVGETAEITVTGVDLNQAPEVEWLQGDGDRIIGRVIDRDGDQTHFQYRRAGTDTWSAQQQTGHLGYFNFTPSSVTPGETAIVEVRATDGRKFSAVKSISFTPPYSGPIGAGFSSQDGFTQAGSTGDTTIGGTAIDGTAIGDTAGNGLALDGAVSEGPTQTSGDAQAAEESVPTASSAPVTSNSLFGGADDDLLALDDYFGMLL